MVENERIPLLSQGITIIKVATAVGDAIELAVVVVVAAVSTVFAIEVARIAKASTFTLTKMVLQLILI